ncbi:MAG: Hint domain-containing protein [Pseudomonadota bacterium]
MSWVGLADGEEAQFDLGGLLGRTRPPSLRMADRKSALACRGTIMLEADVAQFTVPRPLIDYGLGASYTFSVAFGDSDMLDFTLSVGAGAWEHRLPLRITNDLQVVRIAYAWDTTTRAGILSVYQPRSRHLSQCIVPNPKPIPWAALRELVHDAPEQCRENDVRFLAVSRAFEPAGAMPGLSGAVEVATPTGARPIREIVAGDLVLTPTGAARRVAAPVRRIVPARGSFAAHRLRAPYLGLARDLTLSGETLVHLEGPDVEYLLGVEGVLAQADQLGETRAPVIAEQRATACYHQLVLEDVDVFDAGIGVASLDLGAGARDGVAGATTLWADVPDGGPQGHAPAPFSLARTYEIVTLNAARAA